jgi:hypothetical protein
MIAYCGMDCSKCEGYLATKEDNDTKRKEVAAFKPSRSKILICNYDRGVRCLITLFFDSIIVNVIFEKAVRSFLLVGMSVNFLGFSGCKPSNLLSSFFRERLATYSIKARVLTPKVRKWVMPLT